MVVKTLYHGTNSASSIRKNGFKLSKVSLYGDGIYFFQTPSYARNYGKQVVSARVLIKKPFTFTQEQNKLYMKLYQKYKSRGESFPQKKAINELFRKYKYDGLKFLDFSRSRRGATAWVIPKKSQIKKIS